MTMNETLLEAFQNGMAVVLYQTPKGLSLGFIETSAITDALGRQEDGEDFYGSVISTAEGGRFPADTDTNILEAMTAPLPGLWDIARDSFIDENEDD
jgi:hypothetical protein